MLILWDTGSLRKESGIEVQTGDERWKKDFQNNDTYVPILHHSLNLDNISGIKDDRPQ